MNAMKQTTATVQAPARVPKLLVLEGAPTVTLKRALSVDLNSDLNQSILRAIVHSPVLVLTGLRTDECCEPSLAVMSCIIGGDVFITDIPVAEDRAAMKAPLSMELCRADVTSRDVMLHVKLILYSRLSALRD